MGCRFDGLTGNGATRVMVSGAQADSVDRAPLFEYGTCSADRPLRTWPSSIINSDVFDAFEPGRVPYR